MLHPSYSDLMNVVNSNVEEGEEPVVNSRYSIVMATAKRARQIIEGKKALVNVKGAKPLSIAVEELNQGKIKILTEEEANALGTRYLNRNRSNRNTDAVREAWQRHLLC